MRKIEVDIRYIQKTRERGRRQTKRGRYASLVCCSQQAGQGCLEVYETRRNETHATSGRTSGEVLGILGSTMLDPEGLAREKV